MPPSFVWKFQPLFISSTFRDMGLERDQLRDGAFTRLAERLRERCHFLNVVDLRQGVETGSAEDNLQRERQILKVCLLEIERSRPFLVALLGDRYGWVPPTEQIQVAAREAGLPEHVDVKGCSVTELEILFGVLECPEQRRRSWFYFRTVDRTDMPPDIAAQFPAEALDDRTDSPASRLRKLKQRIRAQMPERVRDYTVRWNPHDRKLEGIEELDRQIEEDLWKDLDAETTDFLRHAPRTWQEADARELTDFVAERLRGYVDRPAVTEAVLAHARSSYEQWGLCTTGPSGSGKSGLFARIWQALQPEVEDGRIVLLAHAAGISPESCQTDRMLRRWIAELATHLGIPNPLDELEKSNSQDDFAFDDARDSSEKKKTKPPTADEIFSHLVDEVAGTTRVLVLIDALEQLDSGGLSWVPSTPPNSFKLVATSIPKEDATRPRWRDGIRIFPLQSITREEAEAIATRFNRERHHRGINARMLEVLLEKRTGSPTTSDPSYIDPLWLSLSLQEINLIEYHEYERAEHDYSHLHGSQRIEALQVNQARALPSDAQGMYGELLGRAGLTWGRDRVAAFASLLALSRGGWRERDLQALLPAVTGMTWDEVAFAGFRRTLGMHIVQRGRQEQWDCSHAAFRQAALNRYLADPDRRRNLHAGIADHLQTLPADDPLRVSETMYHLIRLGDRDRAAAYLAEINPPELNNKSKMTLVFARNAIGEEARKPADGSSRDQFISWLISLMGIEDYETTWRICHFFRRLRLIGDFTDERLKFPLLEPVTKSLDKLVNHDPLRVDWRRDLADSLYDLGKSIFPHESEAAIKIFQKAWNISFSLGTSDDVKAEERRFIGHMLWKIGENFEKRKNAISIDLFRKSLAISEKLLADDPSENQHVTHMCWKHFRIGNLQEGENLFSEANETYSRALTFASDDLDSGYCYYNIGNAKRAQNDLAGAKKAYQKAFAFLERVAASAQSGERVQETLSTLYSRLGELHKSEGDPQGALDNFRKAQTLQESIAAAHPNDKTVQMKLAGVYDDLTDLLCDLNLPEDSKELSRKAKCIRELHASLKFTNRTEEASHYIEQGKQHQANGDIEEALKTYKSASSVLLAISTPNKTDAELMRKLVDSLSSTGDALRSHNDTKGWYSAQCGALSILRRLTELNPADYAALKDLDRLLVAIMDGSGALKFADESIRIRKRLVESDESNTENLTSLTEGYLRIIGLLNAQGSFEKSLPYCLEIQHVYKRLGSMAPEDPSTQGLLAATFCTLGDTYNALFDYASALQFYRKERAIHESFDASIPTETSALIMWKIGDVLNAQGNASEAQHAFSEYERIVERLDSISAAKKPLAQSLRNLMRDLCSIGDGLKEQGCFVRALQSYQAALSLHFRNAKSSKLVEVDQYYLAANYLRIGSIQRELGNLPASLGAFQTALSIYRRLADVKMLNTDAHWYLAVTYQDMDSLAESWRKGESLDKPDQTLYIHACLGETYWEIGRVLELLDKPDEALSIYMKWVEVSELILAAIPDDPSIQHDLVVGLKKLASLRKKTGDEFSAKKTELDAEMMIQKVEGDDPSLDFSFSDRYMYLADQCAENGDHENAIKAYRESFVLRQQFVDKLDGCFAQLVLGDEYESYAQYLESMGKLPEAYEAYSKAIVIHERNRDDYSSKAARLQAKAILDRLEQEANKPE